MHKPIVYFTLAFVAGLIANKYIALPAWQLLIVAGALFLYTISTLVRKRGNLLILPLALFLGMFWHQVHTEAFNSIDAKFLEVPVSIKGTVSKVPQFGKNNLQYLLVVESISLSAGKEEKVDYKIILRDYEPQKVYAYGDFIQVKGKIKLPRLPSNPGEFDYHSYLTRQGVAGVISTWQSQQLEKGGIGKVNPFVKMALQVKEKLAAVNHQTLSPDNAQLLEGMIFGTKGQLEEETLQAFRQIGVAHVLAVSGLHVGIILGPILFLGQLLRLPERKRYLLAAAFLVFYAVMTGLTPSVLRATIMALVILLGLALNRNNDWPTSISLAALILLFINPLYLWEVGFQLSFVATWAILYLVPLLNGAISWPTGNFKSILTVPLAAQLGTWPILAYHFNIFSPISLFANIFLVFIVSIIIPLGFLAAFLGLVSLTLAEILNVTTSLLLELLRGATFVLNELPGAFWFVRSPPLWVSLFWFALLIFTGAYFSNRQFRQKLRIFNLRHKGKVITVNSIILVFFVWQGVAGFSPTPLLVNFLDVGQGDSAVITTPAGKTIVIDTGGKPDYLKSYFDPGDRVVAPFLQRQGLNKIDTILLTHPHEDHIGGTLALLNKFEVGLVIISPVKSKSKGYRKILETLKAKKIPTVVAETGDIIDIDQTVQLLILHPDQEYAKASTDLNNNSVVLKLLYGQRGFLFTGDIETHGISRLLMVPPQQLKADVLKVPHHGSNTSLVPSFYQRVQPEVAIFSVGENNRYGHPSKKVLEALKAYGVAIYRTDQHGAITVRSDGQLLEVVQQKGVQ